MSPAPGQRAARLRTVVAGACIGTTFEWYEFFVFGGLSAITSRIFFAQLDPSTGLIAALLVFGAGFLFRPIGALIFGALGDRYGRKIAFMSTVVMMGGATIVMGLLPTYAQVGLLAPALLVLTRIIQGIAVGGEYGGAAIYVAEHARPGTRGFFTAWIQCAAAFGLILALGTVLVVRTALGEAAFEAWGWRLPFLLSIAPLVFSIWLRMKLSESPVFRQMQADGEVSRAPLAEAFGRWENVKLIMIALLAFLLAQGAIWYTAFFYSQIFLERLMKAPAATVNLLTIGAALLSVPLYLGFGALSDRVGRKPIIWGGLVVAVIGFFPAFHLMALGANPALVAAQARAPVSVQADLSTCAFQFDLVGKAVFASPCDISKAVLAGAGVSHRMAPADEGAPTRVIIGEAVLTAPDARGLPTAEVKAVRAGFETEVKAALAAAGYPAKADPAATRLPLVFLGLSILVLAATMVYGPLAAALTEMFPPRIRYSAMSLPFHIGAGWVGGFVPVMAFAIVAATGDVFAGGWYPLSFAAVSAVLCLLLWKEQRTPKSPSPTTPA